MAVSDKVKKFESGKVIKTQSGQSLEIIQFIAGGGQGDVYRVKYAGEEKALKWYTCSFENKASFKKNLSDNVLNGKPSKQFAWPLAITEELDGSFGYVMDLIPSGYYEVNDYIMTHVQFSSYKAITEACIQIVQAFRGLHLKGLAYQDLNGSNFFIEPTKGKVMICDNDNVAPNGTSTGILGTPGYIAPEVYTGSSNPNTRSDQFSMAVLIFMLFCMTHPLEGKRWADATVMTPNVEEKLYGTEPIFICDPTDNSNGPVQGIHKNLLNRWKYLPQYMKDIFIKAFSKETFSNPSRRPSEAEWLEQLCRFRSEIVPCSCGKSEVFLIDGKSTKCDVCGRLFEVKHRIKLPEYDLPIVGGGRLYLCQIKTCKVEESLNPVASLLMKDPETFGIRNKTKDVWRCITPSGKMKQVGPDEVIPVKTGIKIDVNGVNLELE